MPAPAIVNANFDLLCTYAPNFACNPETASAMLVLVILGIAAAGRRAVKFMIFDPM